MTPDDDDLEFADVAVLLAAAVPPVDPPAAVKLRLFAQLDGPQFRFAADGAFATTPYPGMTMRLLNIDKERRQFAAMIRLEPGGLYPSHAHDGPEECVVLEGELLVGGVRMKAGDYQRSEPGSEHADQWSDTGALLFVTGPLSLMSSS